MQRWITIILGYRLMILALIVGILAGVWLWWGLPPVARWTVRMSPNSYLVGASSEVVLTMNPPRVFDIRTGRELPELARLIPENAHELQFCPDGSIAFVRKSWPLEDGGIELVRLAPRTLDLQSLYRWPAGPVPLHWQFAPDGRTLAISPRHNHQASPLLIDIPTWRLRHELQLDDGVVRGFAPDGRTLVYISSGRQQCPGIAVVLIDVDTAEQRAVIPRSLFDQHLFWAFTPDCQRLVLAGEPGPTGTVLSLDICDVASGVQRGSVPIGLTENYGLEATSDGKTLLNRGDGQTIRELEAYDLDTLQLRWKAPAADWQRCDCSRDGRWLAAIRRLPHESVERLVILDLATGLRLVDLGEYSFWTVDLPFLRDGDFMLLRERTHNARPVLRKLARAVGLDAKLVETSGRRINIVRVPDGSIRGSMPMSTVEIDRQSPFETEFKIDIIDWPGPTITPDGKAILVQHRGLDRHALDCYDILPATSWFRILTGALIACLAFFFLGRSASLLWRASTKRLAATPLAPASP